MATLHIENTVRDYDAWKAAFDSYDQFRQNKGVLAYRISRRVGQADELVIDLDFETVAEAEQYIVALDKIWQTPKSGSVMVKHQRPQVLDLLEQRRH
jgi:hypothetical protein